MSSRERKSSKKSTPNFKNVDYTPHFEIAMRQIDKLLRENYIKKLMKPNPVPDSLTSSDSDSDSDSKKSRAVKKRAVVTTAAVPASTYPRNPADLKITDQEYLIVPMLSIFGENAAQKTPNFIKHQIEPANQYYKGLARIIQDIFRISIVVGQHQMSAKDKKELSKMDIMIKYQNVVIKPPVTITGEALYPLRALQELRTYSGEVTVDIHVSATKYKHSGEEEKDEFVISRQNLCRVPVIVKSDLCHTHNKSAEELRAMKEDPEDVGGNFIIEGKEWIIEPSTNIEFGSTRIFRNKGFQNEETRLEYISKGGDDVENSDELIIRILKDKQLTVEILRKERNDTMKTVFIPFHILYRLMGWTSDKKIVEFIMQAPVHILEDSKETRPGMAGKLDEVQKRNTAEVFRVLNDAFNAQYTFFNDVTDVTSTPEVARMVARELFFTEKFKVADGIEVKKKADANTDADADIKMVNGAKKSKKNKFAISDEVMASLVAQLYKYIDVHFLPHCGTTPASRDHKLRELSFMLHEMVLVHLGLRPETNRDDYTQKRLHTNGYAFSKQTKTTLNISAVSTTRSQVLKHVADGVCHTREGFKNTITQALTSTMFGARFEAAMTKAVKLARGEEYAITSDGRKARNRMTTQQLLRRSSPMNVYSIHRTISTPIGNSNKSSTRSMNIRDIDPTMCGFVCIVSTPEGEKVGLNLSLAISAQITETLDSHVIREKLRSDPTVRNLDNLTPDVIYRDGLSPIFINGYCVGYVANAYEFWKKYRDMRRRGEIYTRSTVSWDTKRQTVNIWVDRGRPIRPVIIVYNTWDNPELFVNDPEVGREMKKPRETRPFKQGILLTEEHIEAIKNGNMYLDDLIRMGIVEWITPPEMANNCLMACGAADLAKYARDPTYTYTHLDFPQMNMGLAALCAIFPEHSATPRNVFIHGQIKHCAGTHTPAWPFRPDKNTYLQYNSQKPIVMTLGTSITMPTGCNGTVALACYTGYNEDDSAIGSSGAIQRGFLDCCKFTYQSVEHTDNKRHFRKPDVSNTRDINPEHNYNKLGDNGMVPVGTYLEKGDVLIAMIVEIAEDAHDGKFIYADRSLIYKGPENGIVYNVLDSTRADGTRFVRVCIRIPRKLVEGDKISTRTGQKNIIAKTYNDSDLPFTSDGVTPVVIMNPHGIPTRMTCGDLMEKIISVWAAKKGCFADATYFMQHNVDSYIKEIQEIDPTYTGRVECYSGMTGERMDRTITMGPACVLRLLKFVADTEQANMEGPIDHLTRQPVGGKTRDGGLRLGEMEKDTLVAHGSLRFLSHKFRTHSDGCPIYVCSKCGGMAIVNHEKRIYSCKRCGNGACIYEVQSTWSAKLLFSEIDGMMIDTRIGITPPAICQYI